ncbi:hypothetical protein [Tessaracoccus palaemonis]|uniref:PNPLA domain-containing protein n=1 Tax=Tessaracoccus palaemonis TaxID=2829499 RepID=A0ABX8SKD3_9ACTN|nr:hypothetical protein [Tessaracoccus palaemonis]QXT63349.1 hypothetical protein KDB89_02365 [Tessaracoccus palaemonis]
MATPLAEPGPQLPLRELMATTAVVVCFVVMGELDRLIGGIAVGQFQPSMAGANALRCWGPDWPADDPLAVLHGAVIADVDLLAWRLILTYALIDCVAAVAYAFLLHQLLTRSRVSVPDPPFAVLLAPIPWVAVAAGVLDGLENLAIAVSARIGPEHWPGAVAVALTLLKWLFVARAALPLAYALGSRDVRPAVGRWLHALWAQGFSLLAVLPVAVLSLVPAPGVFDQLPDVQRTWLEFWSVGQLHAVVAMVVLATLAWGLFVLGRLVTSDAMARLDGSAAPRERVPLWLWLIGPAVVGAAVAASLVAGGHPRWVAFVVFAAIPLAVAASSWWLRPRRSLQQPPPRAAGPVEEMWLVGDLLALLPLSVGAVGLIRSYTSVVALQGFGFAAVASVCAAGGALAAWRLIPHLVAVSPTTLVDPQAGPALGPRAGEESAGLRLLKFAWGALAVSVVVLAVVAVWPGQAAEVAGVLGAFMVAWGAIVVLGGSLVVINARYKPPEIFWTRAFRLREVPVAGLLVAVLFAGATLGGAEVHPLRGSGATGAATVGWSEAAVEWRDRIGRAQAADEEVCRFTDGAGAVLRPLIMVAAEGGGIRAAYWTAATMAAISRASGCGLDAVAVASGVSGGSVGLSVLRVSDADAAVDGVARMGGASALGQASIGLLVRDPLYAAAGVPVGATAEAPWRDRAALMEDAWVASVPALGGDFYAPPTGALSAPLVLNSADAVSGCRVLVTQLDVSSEVESTCTGSGPTLPASRPIADYLSSSTDEDRPRDVYLDGLSVATAAMASARFPYVTPSGVVGPCGDAPRAQLIDGGYIAGSDLGTLIDLAPHLLDTVSLPDDVVPIVVYLHNEVDELLTGQPAEISELAVPPVGWLNANTSLSTTSAWLQRAAALSETVGWPNPTHVFVVAPDKEPAIAPPLGWQLSSVSRQSMDDSITDAEAQCGLDEEPREGVYRGLAALLTALGCAAR